MKFSVIIPIYNCEALLPRCIESIINQTYPDWELILVDDGSTDASFSLCEAYSKKDGRIRVIHQANAGQGAARNNGITTATGDYIVFCDSDDFYEEDALEVFDNAARDEMPDLIVGGYRDFCHSVDGGMTVRNENPAYDLQCATNDEARAEFMRLKKQQLIEAPWAKAYLRRIIVEHTIRFPDMRRQQDIFFNVDFYDGISTLKVIRSIIYNYYLPDNDDQLRKFPKDMFGILKTNYLKTVDSLENWQRLDSESLRYLNQRFIKNVSVLLRLNYCNQWELSKKERRAFSQKMLCDDVTITACSTVPTGMINKFIYLLIKLKCVKLINLFSFGTLCYQRWRAK